MPRTASQVGVCPECDDWSILSGGNGRCSQCHGTGINSRMNDPVPECPGCRGTGVCVRCSGSGLALLNPPLDGTVGSDPRLLEASALSRSQRRRDKLFGICLVATWIAIVFWRWRH